MDGEAAFEKFVNSVYENYQSGVLSSQDIGQADNDTLSIDFFPVLVTFICSMVTTVGFGDIVPKSQNGRIFCLAFGLVGVPLLLIVVADMAKFVSSGLVTGYTEYLKMKAKVQAWFRPTPPEKVSPSPLADLKMLNDDPMFRRTSEDSIADYIWENLDTVQYVQIPTIAIFVIIAAYCGLGALVLTHFEDWTPFEAFYFSFISVFKIGFGDFVPQNPKYILLCLAYMFFGLILTTACIDSVGVYYLYEIHYLGRRLERIDPLADLQKKKYQRQRKATMQHLFSVMAIMRNFKPPTPEEKSLPPGPPTNLQVAYVTPYSVKLTWDPPAAPSKLPITYTIRCKPKRSSWQTKLNRTTKPRFRSHVSTMPRQLTQLTETEMVITGLTSFSIYEFKLWAVNEFGKSNHIRITQITEPETAPQNIEAEIVSPNQIRLKWDSPYKKQKDIEQYAVYYTENPVEPYDRWKKLFTTDTERSVTLQALNQNSTYAFSVAAQYKTGHSPISRSLIAETKVNEEGELIKKDAALSNYEVEYNPEGSSTTTGTDEE